MKRRLIFLYLASAIGAAISVHHEAWGFATYFALTNLGDLVLLTCEHLKEASRGE